MMTYETQKKMVEVEKVAFKAADEHAIIIQEMRATMERISDECSIFGEACT